MCIVHDSHDGKHGAETVWDGGHVIDVLFMAEYGTDYRCGDVDTLVSSVLEDNQDNPEDIYLDVVRRTDWHCGCTIDEPLGQWGWCEKSKKVKKLED